MVTQTALNAKAPTKDPRFRGTVSGITQAMVGLRDVNNTSDLGKPISTETQTALYAKAPTKDPRFTGTVSGITQAMVGLGDVNNTSDLGKPISDATQTALNGKAPTSYANLSRNTIMEKLTVTDYLNTNLDNYINGKLISSLTADELFAEQLFEIGDPLLAYSIPILMF